MAEARRRSEWGQTSAILRIIGAVHGVELEDEAVNPFCHEDAADEGERPRIPVSALAGIFVKGAKQ